MSLWADQGLQNPQLFRTIVVKSWGYHSFNLLTSPNNFKCPSRMLNSRRFRGDSSAIILFPTGYLQQLANLYASSSLISLISRTCFEVPQTKAWRFESSCSHQALFTMLRIPRFSAPLGLESSWSQASWKSWEVKGWINKTKRRRYRNTLGSKVYIVYIKTCCR